MTSDRRTITVPGYDCRITCEHTPKAAGPMGHGICAEKWVYALVDRSIGAIELTVSTPFFPPTVTVDWTPKFEGYNLSLHAPHPVNKEQVKLGERATQPCGYLGRCYDAGSWGLLADEFVAKHFSARPGGQARLLPNQPESFWTAFEELFLDLAKKNILSALLEGGDLKWTICEACDGHGVLEVKDDTE